ncbi:MAG: phosphoenolpyruvate synthase [Rikenellaceae bacterium]|jgi:CheY-like chemotaxis protein|nr:phosphoenolpyruvate synthase [Rikenellaceae bacterium]
MSPQPLRPEQFTVTDYNSLMQRRVSKILLVCSSYDGFILEEDGRIETRINQEYTDLNLSNPPSFARVSTGAEALDKLQNEGGFDLVISMMNIGETDVFSFAKTAKSRHPTLPIVLLANFTKDMKRHIESHDRTGIDYVFYWQGNADLIIAIIKTIEDRMNADNDILGVGVQSIMLVEDSIRYYSTYLPALYKLVLQQNSEFLNDALNEQQKVLRKRARPKILFSTNYTEAVEYYEKYKDNMLGVISDIGFVINKYDRSEDEKLDAGIDLCRLIRKDKPLMPFLFQSSQKSMRAVAEELGVGFLVKHSKTLLIDLAEYISEEFAFGDFVFKDLRTGAVIAKAKDLRQMQHSVAEVPDDVLVFHAQRDHLSKWMFSRGIFPLAVALRGVSMAQFASTAAVRKYCLDIIREYRMQMGQGIVANFEGESYDETLWFARMGEGSLGGKARGLAFANNMLRKYGLFNKYPGVRITIPRTVVIATDYFDEFIKLNALQHVINADYSDEDLLLEFVASSLPAALIEELRAYIQYTGAPLAVRSSSKLEDSYMQPFAGIYSTYMVPHVENRDYQLRLLSKAIKSVYASVYFASSRVYIATTQNLFSDERMAIVVQEVCGSEEGGWFFPTLSGTASSINFYPIGDEKPEDGIVKMATGLGKLVVEGGQVLRFSPRHPKKILQLSTPELALRDTQRNMYALDLNPDTFKASTDDAVNLRKFDLRQMTGFRNMNYVASTWDATSDTMIDSNEEPGRKVITFAHILKYNTFPVADIIADLLEMGEREMGTPVEIEFAANLDVPSGEQKIFNFLQIRPIIEADKERTLDWSEIDTSRALIYSENALGVGAMSGIHDIVYVKTGVFDKRDTEKIAEELLKLNAEMQWQGRGYVLVGPGRWGSTDPWLGIPVRWNHISEARVIVECGLPDFRVEPSQGTHFFQNLTSLGVGYLTINPFAGDGVFDEPTLDAHPASYDGEFLRAVHFDNELFVFIDGQNSKGIVKI